MTDSSKVALICTTLPVERDAKGVEGSLEKQNDLNNRLNRFVNLATSSCRVASSAARPTIKIGRKVGPAALHATLYLVKCYC